MVALSSNFVSIALAAGNVRWRPVVPDVLTRSSFGCRVAARGNEHLGRHVMAVGAENVGRGYPHPVSGARSAGGQWHSQAAAEPAADRVGGLSLHQPRHRHRTVDCRLDRGHVSREAVRYGARSEVLSPQFDDYADLLMSSVPEMEPGWLETAIAGRKMASAGNRATGISKGPSQTLPTRARA